MIEEEQKEKILKIVEEHNKIDNLTRQEYNSTIRNIILASEIFKNNDWKDNFKEYLKKKEVENFEVQELNNWALNMNFEAKKKFYHMLRIKNDVEELNKFKRFIEVFESER